MNYDMYYVGGRGVPAIAARPDCGSPPTNPTQAEIPRPRAFIFSSENAVSQTYVGSAGAAAAFVCENPQRQRSPKRKYRAGEELQKPGLNRCGWVGGRVGSRDGPDFDRTMGGVLDELVGIHG